MKILILALALCAAPLFAQTPNGCDAASNPLEALVQVTSTTATTLVPWTGGIIHVCQIYLSTGTATSISLQGSDGTALWSNIQNVGTLALNFNGTLTTRRAARASAFQIVFGTAPASSVGVFVTYYTTPS